MPLWLAEQEKIPFPRTEQAHGRSTGLVGAVLRYRGLIHVRLFGEEFDWPCDFLESQVPANRQGYGVIGRAGFLAAVNFCIAPPFCSIERWRDHLPRWRRLLLRLVPTWAREHPADSPL